MGLYVSKYFTHPDTTPTMDQDPTFDPNLGFTNGRKERVMLATEQELISAKVPLDKRDYCAHLALDILVCHRKNFPFVFLCKPEKHNYLECEYEDYVMRMKEFERERRLLERRKRIEGAA